MNALRMIAIAVAFWTAIGAGIAPLVGHLLRDRQPPETSAR